MIYLSIREMKKKRKVKVKERKWYEKIFNLIKGIFK